MTKQNKCLCSIKGKCKSEYNYNKKCDGIKIRKDCPYELVKQQQHRDKLK